MAVSSPCLGLAEKKQWWLSDKQVRSFDFVLILLWFLKSFDDCDSAEFLSGVILFDFRWRLGM